MATAFLEEVPLICERVAANKKRTNVRVAELERVTAQLTAYPARSRRVKPKTTE